MSFSRQTTTPERQHDAVAIAYRAAGVPAPTARTAALAAIEAEPGSEAVALELAREAYTTQDGEKFLKAALDRVARAQAADALRAALARADILVRRETIGSALEQAAVDLAPRFAEIVKQLTAAAKQLDRDRPLELANAVRDDTTKALKAAQAGVTALGPFASMYVQKPSSLAPPALNAVLPVVALPECVVEARVNSGTENPRTVNTADLTGTHAVRAFALDLERDVDSALVKAARGDFAGVTLALVSGKADLDRRLSNAVRAHKRRFATNEEARGVSVRA